MSRSFHLAGFQIAGPVTHSHAAWRHPKSKGDFLSLETARGLLRDLAVAATGWAPPDPALQLCPHPRDGACECRKPEPGMLLSIMRYYGVEAADTLFVGDAEVDREAAARAGTSFMWASDLFG